MLKLFFYFVKHQKGAHLYQRGAILTGRYRRLAEAAAAPNSPPGSATDWSLKKGNIILCHL